MIFGEGPTQGLDDTTAIAEKKYSINFSESKNKFYLNLHYNGANYYLFVNGVEIHKFSSLLVRMFPRRFSGSVFYYKTIWLSNR